MSRSEQLVTTRAGDALSASASKESAFAELRAAGSARAGHTLDADVHAAARRALRRQIARLERELSAVIADCFPDIAPVEGGAMRRRELGGHLAGRPRLLGIAELELERDALVARLGEARASAAARAELHRQGRELLAAMQLEPARYKYVRLRAVDVGERGCGVWEVRPKLGLIGMLAGWWQVKLSSGCPLPRGCASAWP